MSSAMSTTPDLEQLAQNLRDAEAEYARVRGREANPTVIAAAVIRGEEGLSAEEIEAAAVAWAKVDVALDALLSARAAQGEASP